MELALIGTENCGSPPTVSMTALGPAVGGDGVTSIIIEMEGGREEERGREGGRRREGEWRQTERGGGREGEKGK